MVNLSLAYLVAHMLHSTAMTGRRLKCGPLVRHLDRIMCVLIGKWLPGRPGTVPERTRASAAKSGSPVAGER